MLVPVLVDFAHALRAEGLTVGTGDVLTYCQAVVTLDPTDLADLYWAGRTSLITRREDIAVYDTVFRRFYLDAAGPVPDVLLRTSQAEISEQAAFDIPATEPPDMGRPEEAMLGLMASTVEVLRHKSFATCTDDELRASRRIMARMRLRPPLRRTRRTVTGASGRKPDLRRTIRESLRMGGDPVTLYWCCRRTRPRPLILVLDVSGSMADYSRAFVQFAHSAGRAVRRVEVFCFGTRLSRITLALRDRDPDLALRRAAAEVVDWEGGTRIGASIDRFVRDWGRRGLCRGGIVVICSDGLDRGDPELLAGAMERLSRLCHRIVWLNPHATAGGPRTLGLIAADPYLDLTASGRDLSGLARFADALAGLG